MGSNHIHVGMVAAAATTILHYFFFSIFPSCKKDTFIMKSIVRTTRLNRHFNVVWNKRWNWKWKWKLMFNTQHMFRGCCYNNRTICKKKLIIIFAMANELMCSLYDIRVRIKKCRIISILGFFFAWFSFYVAVATAAVVAATTVDVAFAASDR